MSTGHSTFDEQIDALMGRVYRRAGYPSFEEAEKALDASEGSLDAVFKPEACAPGADSAEERERMREEMSIAARYFGRFMGYIFARGPHPKHTTPRLYTICHAVAPHLLLNMSQAEIAGIFGQGRAAQSARSRDLDKRLEKVGHASATFGGSKSAGAREKMKRAAKGNKNRAGSVEKMPTQQLSTSNFQRSTSAEAA